MNGFPRRVYPTGWFQVDWSEELEPGSIKPLQIFDTEVVLYRTHDGVVRLCDAYCPHFGAHLSGGSVVGENLACPFHGWEFDTRGRNVRIPFADRVNTRVCLRHWPTAEVDGFILVWHDGLGRDPMWAWPGAVEFTDAARYYPPSQYLAGVRHVIPQQLLENNNDPLHFPFVHGSGEPATRVTWVEDGPLLSTRLDLRLGLGKEGSWLTPNGPVTSHIDVQGFGLGLALLRLEIDDLRVSQLVGATPVDRERSLVFSTTTGMRADAPGTDAELRVTRMMKAQQAQVEADFKICERQRYVANPPLSCGEERSLLWFRRWAEQFYPEPCPEDPALRNGNGADVHATGVACLIS